jgi:hypothetical protein
LQPLGGTSSRGINANITRKQPTAKNPVAIPVDPQILATFSSATLLSGTHLTNDDYDEDISNPDLMVLSVEEQGNAMHLLDIIMIKPDTVDSATNEDADLDLLDTLDEAAQTFDETDPVHIIGS